MINAHEWLTYPLSYCLSTLVDVIWLATFPQYVCVCVCVCLCALFSIAYPCIVAHVVLCLWWSRMMGSWEQMDEIQDPPLVILRLYFIFTFFDGKTYQDVATRDDQLTRYILVTHVSQEDASSSCDGLWTYEYRLPFQVFGLTSPSMSTNGSTRELTMKMLH